MTISITDILSATRLTRTGQLVGATKLIQQALRGAVAAAPNRSGTKLVEPDFDGDVVDVEVREVTEPAQTTRRSEIHPDAPQAAFDAGEYRFGADVYHYRLYRPGAADSAKKLPLLVLLHGCKQDAADFARGTAMNTVAERENFMVLYPEQLRKSNGMGCWNWFEPAHQGRDAGEPAMLAALVKRVVAEHGGDPTRVYVAGLSAGAAMAALLGQLHPGMFAAVGLHSGLPAGAAHDVASAFSAMRKGSTKGTPADGIPIPTIVFHGSADSTVSPRNGDAVVQQQIAAMQAHGASLEVVETQATGAGRSASRRQWVDQDQRTVLESWIVSGGPHAWSGGDAAGSFTDPQGPSASEAMAHFFLQHRLS